LQGHRLAHQPGEIFSGSLKRSFHHRALHLLAAQRCTEFLDSLI